MADAPPDFSAEEINALSMRMHQYSSRQEYQIKCHKFLMQFEEEEIHWDYMSDAQRRWLWGIKAMIREWV